MKQKTTLLFGMLSMLLLLSMATAYAHSSQERTRSFGGASTVDEMHDIMTEGLDPELKEQMDVLHEGCMGQFGNQESYEEYAREINMMGDRTFNGMMS